MVLGKLNNSGLMCIGQQPLSPTESPSETDLCRFFSSDSYEFEVEDDRYDNNDNDPCSERDAASLATKITERMVSSTKIVYLIRHAESDENRRQQSLHRSVGRIGKLILPAKEDVAASVELLDVKAQIDSDVSEVGRKQIEQVGSRLKKDNFVEEKGIQLVAHSPLKRARQTAEGMLGCVTSRPGVTLEEDISSSGRKAPTVGRIVELPVLAERTPIEILPINHDAYTKRIAGFEKWLREQPEDVIAIVGHSQYFKNMLGLPFKFGNCDVWEVRFDPSVSICQRSVKTDVITTERKEKLAKIRAKLERSKSSNLEEISGVRSFDEISEQMSYSSDSGEALELPRGWSNLTNLYRYTKTDDEYPI